MAQLLMSQTQIRAVLTLTVAANFEGDIRLFSIPLVELTALITWLWAAGRQLHRLLGEIWAWGTAIAALVSAVGMAVKVFLMWLAVVISALKYGLVG